MSWTSIAASSTVALQVRTRDAAVNVNRLDLLRDPSQNQPLGRMRAPDAQLVQPLHPRSNRDPIGVTDIVLSTRDGGAYPIVEGIPVLMRPERLGPPGTMPESHDVMAEPYAEAYAEHDLYTELAGTVLGRRSAAEIRRMIDVAEPSRFFEPAHAWMSGGSTAGAYSRAMHHLAPAEGCVVLQIGGIGTHALKLLHAGASHAVVVSPVIGELIAGRVIAERHGFADRATFVAGLAEELPIENGVVHRVYSGSSLHHTDTARSFSEIERVLDPNGRMASVDVWRASLHRIGTSLFGKAHGNTHCRPFDDERIAPARVHLDSLEVSFHGAALRYPLAIGERLGVRPSAAWSVRLAAAEDRLPLGPLTPYLASLVCLTGSIAS